MSDHVGKLESARKDSSFLARANVPFLPGTDLNLALSSWARLSVPFLADWCLIELITAEGGVRRAATAFRFPGSENGNLRAPEPKATRQLDELPEFLVQLVREKRAFFEDPVRSAWIGQYVPELNVTGIMVLPLEIGGKVAGFVTWLMEDESRKFTSDRLVIAKEYSQRIATSIESLSAFRSSQDKAQFHEEILSIASHELQTPLTVLILQLQFMQRNLPTDPEALVPVKSLKKGLSSIESSTIRLSESVHQLLDLTRIQSDQLTISRDAMDLAPIVHDVCDSLAPALEDSKCTLELDLEQGTYGKWDRFRLRQVVSNLVSNAIKYAPGGPIRVSLSKSADFVTVSVKDHGRGIAPDDQETIFERYTRKNESGKASGLGLGLYICRKVIELHGGRIWVESKIGEGAKFSFQLPHEPV